MRTVHLLLAPALLSALTACGGARPAHPGGSQDSFTFTPPASIHGDQSVVGAGKLPSCDLVRKPVEELGLRLKRGSGTATCLFAASGHSRKSLSVTILARDAQAETNYRSNLVSTRRLGRGTVEGLAVDGAPLAVMPCDNLDLVLQSVSEENVVRSIEPLENFLDCTATEP